jgi:hypothetical protein
MTDEERRLFEEDEVHHRGHADSEDGPASEAELVRDLDRPKPAAEPRIVPPNPD